MTTENLRSQSSESQPNYFRRRAAAIGLAGVAALGVAEGVNAIHDGFEPHQIGSPVTEGIDGGGIKTVQDATHELAKRNHISPTDVGDIVRAGQNVEGELQAKYGELFLQPGQPIQVTLEKSTFGGYTVEAHATDESSSK